MLSYCLFLFISCKTNSSLSSDNFDVDVLAQSISLEAVQLHNKNHLGRAYKTDSIYVYGDISKTVIDSIIKSTK